MAEKKKRGLVWAIIGGIAAVLAVFGLARGKRKKAKKG